MICLAFLLSKYKIDIISYVYIHIYIYCSIGEMYSAAYECSTKLQLVSGNPFHGKETIYVLLFPYGDHRT